MTELVLCAKNLGKSFETKADSLEVIKGLNFELRSGEVVAIVGRSGSGKSTLLNLLAGLDLPSVGEVIFCGSSWQTLSETKRDKLRNHDLGFVYQFHHLLSEFTAWENIAMPLRIAGMTKRAAKARAIELLNLVELAQRQDHFPNELSGGERQRVAIARSLACSPRVVLMDEPTGNLDNDTANSVQCLINKIAKESGASFIIVTHDLEVAALAQRVVRLEQGQLVEVNSL